MSILSFILPEVRVIRDQVFPRRERNGDIGWYRFAHGTTWASRTALINHLITVYGYRRYLEIGVRNRKENLEKVAVQEFVGVDPDPAAEADFVMTSDEYFAQDGIPVFDIIFIDGMHHADFVARDIENSLKHLAPNGTIVLHDLNPPSKQHTIEIEEQDSRNVNHVWNGTSWRGFAKFRATRPDLEMYTVDTDWGCGIVRFGTQSLYNGPMESFEDLDQNRKELLNLISVKEFLRLHPS